MATESTPMRHVSNVVLTDTETESKDCQLHGPYWPNWDQCPVCAGSLTEVTYEVDLTCGDTVTRKVAPKVGQYQHCIHCGRSRRVSRVRMPSASVPKRHGLNVVLTDTETGEVTVGGVTVTPDNCYPLATGLAEGAMQFVINNLRVKADSSRRLDDARLIEYLRDTLSSITKILAVGEAESAEHYRHEEAVRQNTIETFGV